MGYGLSHSTDGTGCLDHVQFLLMDMALFLKTCADNLSIVKNRYVALRCYIVLQMALMITEFL